MAKGFTVTMPNKPNVSLWSALVSAYRDHSYYTKEAEVIFEKIVELDPMNPGNLEGLKETCRNKLDRCSKPDSLFRYRRWITSDERQNLCKFEVQHSSWLDKICIRYECQT
ncbi:hypothetical protein V6N13_045532 [Hibiscus sabdariffa]